jgi:aminobenzoyl-glutamate utilization protein B
MKPAVLESVASLAVAATAAIATAGLPSSLRAQDARAQLLAHIDANRGVYERMALEIWDLAEVGYLEVESSKLLQDRLRDAGFDVQAGVAGIPTAFVASWGTGGPVIGILAEFDALPGITQDSVPFPQPIASKAAGHACGHHLFGVASTAAALAARDWLETSGTPGTIRLYGTPAEEGGSGKVYLVRAGLFDDVDVVLHWHAGDANTAAAGNSLANISAKFRFRGVSAHAAAAPHRGRSALDGVEAMNHMANLMREHVPQETRIHYVITRGGAAPNVVPDFAEVYYYVRHPDGRVVHELFERLKKTATAAALGTETEVEHEIIGGVYALLPNEALAAAMHANLERVGGVEYDARERGFAERIHESFPADAPSIDAAAMVQPLEYVRAGTGSTDVGDVSWAVPTAGLRTATWVPGTAAHSWQAIAAGGTSIGLKGMMVAARTLALTAADLFTTPVLVADARAEFERRRGTSFLYRPLVGDREPPLDYRK